MDAFQRCVRCGIPDFMSLAMIKRPDGLVCEVCLTPKEEKEILRERYKKLGLDDSELNDERKRPCM